MRFRYSRQATEHRIAEEGSSDRKFIFKLQLCARLRKVCHSTRLPGDIAANWFLYPGRLLFRTIFRAAYRPLSTEMSFDE